MRSFDPRRVGSLECRAWESYYRRKWGAFLVASQAQALWQFQLSVGLAVGIGAAGWIDASRSVVLFAPNIAWRDEPLRDYVSEAVGLPVIVENDVIRPNVAALSVVAAGC